MCPAWRPDTWKRGWVELTRSCCGGTQASALATRAIGTRVPHGAARPLVPSVARWGWARSWDPGRPVRSLRGDCGPGPRALSGQFRARSPASPQIVRGPREGHGGESRLVCVQPFFC